MSERIQGKLVIYAEANQRILEIELLGVREAKGQKCKRHLMAKRRRLAEIDIKPFKLGAPIVCDRIFDAAAGDPACSGRDRASGISGAGIRSEQI